MGKPFGALPVASPLAVAAGQIRAEISIILTAFQMRKLQVLLTTNAALEAQIFAIANDVVLQERTALHYSNYHTWSVSSIRNDSVSAVLIVGTGKLFATSGRPKLLAHQLGTVPGLACRHKVTASPWRMHATGSYADGCATTQTWPTMRTTSNG
jgi:hypothetical protein